MRKIFTFLCAALMSVGMWAEPIEVVWNNYDLPTDGSGNSFTKDGVTVTCGSIDWDNPAFNNGGTFTTDLGNFTRIYVYASDIDMSGDGWSGTASQQTWTGNAASVSFNGTIWRISDIWFYIEPAGAVPAWVKPGDAWDDATKTLTVNDNPVSNAYINVSDIENLVISDAVTRIGDNAFENCNGLKSVAFGSNLASIGYKAFASCIKLESVTFPASLQKIEKSAFSQCYALTSVTITNGLESIGQQAFYNCEKLASVTTIPSSVTSIGSSAFGNCKVLTEIVVAAENPNYSSADGVLFDKAKTTLIQCPGGKQGEYTIPNSVTSIGNMAFSSCYLLTSVEIPNSVGEIGVQAFSSCIELTSVTIGNGVTSIGTYAFYYCSKLASVTINATTPPTLGNEALNKTAAALTIYVPAASVTDYKGAWTAYADKIEAISGGDEPAEQVITWDNDFCSNVIAYSDWSGQHVEENNTKDGITVTSSDSESNGMQGGLINLYYQENILTFTSTVGDISKIEVYYSDNSIGNIPNGWTHDATNKKLVWEGTAAAAVDMVGGYVYFNVDYIVFTIAGEPAEEGIENIVQTEKAKKVIMDGMIYIEKNGKLFNLTGAEVK